MGILFLVLRSSLLSKPELITSLLIEQKGLISLFSFSKTTRALSSNIKGLGEQVQENVDKYFGILMWKTFYPVLTFLALVVIIGLIGRLFLTESSVLLNIISLILAYFSTKYIKKKNTE